MRPLLSISRTLTVTSSPCLTTSSTLSTLASIVVKCNHPFLTWQYFNEGSYGYDPCYYTREDLSLMNLPCRPSIIFCFFSRSSVMRGNSDDPTIFDVDFCICPFCMPLIVLPLGPITVPVSSGSVDLIILVMRR